MKIQCPCGTKYAFDITPDMANGAFRLVCTQCQTDLTPAVLPHIQAALAELAAAAPSVPPPLPPAPPAPAVSSKATPQVRIHLPTAPTPPAAAKPGIALARATPAPAPVPSEPTPASPPSRSPEPPNTTTTTTTASPAHCSKHRGQLATETCRVCGKPICSECMTSFGYVCSAYCSGQAEQQGIEVPHYAGQRSASIAREGRVFRYFLAAGVSLGMILAALWAFYHFYLSEPHPVLQVTLPKDRGTPQSVLTKEGTSIVLQDGTLTAYHPKTAQVSWQLHLIDTNILHQVAKSQAAQARAEYMRQRDELRRKPRYDREGNAIRMDDEPFLSEEDDTIRRRENLLELTASSMKLVYSNQGLWVKSPGQFIQVDPVSGRPSRTLTVTASGGGDELKPKGSNGTWEGLVRTARQTAERTRVDLERGEVASQTYTFGSGKDEPAPQRARTPAPQRTALPAREIPSPRAETKGVGAVEVLLRAIELKHNSALEDALNDEPELGPRKKHPELPDHSRVEMVESGQGAVKMVVKLIEFKGVIQKTMQDAPTQSVLDGSQPIAGKFTEGANEVLNDLKRSRGDDVRIDDRSRYQVTLKPASGSTAREWTGEVQGPPRWYPLEHVNILAAGEMLTVFDLENQKLWETKLAQPIADLFTDDPASELLPGSSEGAFLETSQHLFVADVAMLTAFEKNTGKVVWRFPTVNTKSLLRDGKGGLYVNTTTAGQDVVKYSHQVNVGRRVNSLVVKLEEGSGKVLWKADAAGHVAYWKDPLLYLSESGEGSSGVPRTTISKLNPQTGKMIWEFTQAGDVRHASFQDRTIQTLSDTGLTVYRYWSF